MYYLSWQRTPVKYLSVSAVTPFIAFQEASHQTCTIFCS